MDVVCMRRGYTSASSRSGAKPFCDGDIETQNIWIRDFPSKNNLAPKRTKGVNHRQCQHLQAIPSPHPPASITLLPPLSNQRHASNSTLRTHTVATQYSIILTNDPPVCLIAGDRYIHTLSTPTT